MRLFENKFIIAISLILLFTVEGYFFFAGFCGYLKDLYWQECESLFSSKKEFREFKEIVFNLEKMGEKKLADELFLECRNAGKLKKDAQKAMEILKETLQELKVYNQEKSNSSLFDLEGSESYLTPHLF